MHGERTEPEVILDVVFERGRSSSSSRTWATGPRTASGSRSSSRSPVSAGAKKMQRLALFRRLEFLAPHKSIEVFLDRSASYFARDEPTKLSAAIAWRTPEGERRAATDDHDLGINRDLGFIEREVPRAG